MSIASTLIPRARVVLLCLATLLLHALTIGWVGAHIDPRQATPATSPAPIVARLHLAAGAPAPPLSIAAPVRVRATRPPRSQSRPS